MTTIQDNRILSFETPLGENLLMITRFKGREGISELFHFDIDLLSENHAISFNDVIGQSGTISILLADGGKRYINGVISRLGQGSGGEKDDGEMRYAYYRATLVPWFWLLTKTTDCRIFQNLSVPDIVESVFKDHPPHEYSLRLQGTYEPREYTVQYRESDFHFVSRLLEDEGIYYFFEHEEGQHTLVLADSPAEHKPCPNQETAVYQTSGHGWLKEDVLKSWQVVKEIRAGKCTLSDYNFECPNTGLEVAIASSDRQEPGEREFYDCPGGYGKRNVGEGRARVRMEEEECRITTIRGASDCRAFTSGFRFTLKEYYRDDMNDKAYVLTRIDHEADQSGSYPGLLSAEAATESMYGNRFECIPHDTPFRPFRGTGKPVVEGVQTAIVVGPEGEEIYTDEYGRVKVLFHWDREGVKGGDASCWIRVRQDMAGNRWGHICLPRVGHEVIVDFIEGDPDRPIITGQVYHGINMPPYELPNEKTKTTFKSNSSPGGGGFNELRFEDKKGEEQLFIFAQKNQDIRTNADLLEWVGNDSHLIIKRDLLEKVERDKHLEVMGDHNEKVTGTVSVNAGMDMQQKVGVKHALEAGKEIHLKAGMKVIIESGVQISLKVGGNFVDIGPTGISIHGLAVKINSGGAAGSGSGCSPDSPKPPKEADTAEPGAKSKVDRESEKAPPPAPPPPTPQAKALKVAAAAGTPFCET